MVDYVTITEVHAGQRIDNFLIAHWQRRCPKSRVYRALRKGEVRVNKGRIQATYRLKIGDVLRLPPIQIEAPMPQHGLKSRLDLDAIRLFEDAHLLVVHKPSGLPVHAGSGYPFGVVECLRDHYPSNAFLDLAHRLDRGTSGVLVLAKKKMALRHLQAQWRDLSVKKTYWALVAGSMQVGKSFQVDRPLQAVRAKGHHKVYVHAQGRTSQTDLSVLAANASVSLLQAQPLTGRMHQIRVHCQSIGHPILGDDTYGTMLAPRLCLHAHAIELAHPSTEEAMRFEAPMPQDLVALMQAHQLSH